MIQNTLVIKTSGRGMMDITSQVQNLIPAHLQIGLCHLFIQHTSASLLITENASLDVQKDIENFFSHWIPDSHSQYLHDMEGPDDMPSHLRSIFTQTSLSVPIENGVLAMGTWQGIFLYEHRLQSHTRKIILSVF